MATEDRERDLERIEKAFDAADAAAGADRAAITQAAQLDAAEAVAMVGIAMEADEEAAEAGRMAMLAERSGSRDAAKKARAKEREARKKARADHKAATKSARAAYNAVRFSDPNGLGFLRVILAVLGLNILFGVFTLTTWIKGSYTIEPKEIVDLVTLLADGVTIWLIFKRKKLARPWVIAVSSFTIVVGTAFNLIAGNFNPIIQVSSSLFEILMIVYFLTSSRVKAPCLPESLQPTSSCNSAVPGALFRHRKFARLSLFS